MRQGILKEMCIRDRGNMDISKNQKHYEYDRE